MFMFLSFGIGKILAYKKPKRDNFWIFLEIFHGMHLTTISLPKHYYCHILKFPADDATYQKWVLYYKLKVTIIKLLIDKAILQQKEPWISSFC